MSDAKALNATPRNYQRLEQIAGHISMMPASGGKGSLVSYTVHDGVAVLLMNSPPVNSFSPQMQASIKAAMDKANADDNVKAIVFTGAGAFFMAGADIPNLMKLANSGASVENVKKSLQEGHALMDLIESGSKPTVAAVNGPALGGGLELAMSCNARIGSKNSKYGLPELKLGIIPGMGGTQRLPRLVGVGEAVKMTLSGKAIAVETEKKKKDLSPLSLRPLLTHLPIIHKHKRHVHIHTYIHTRMWVHTSSYTKRMGYISAQ